MEAEIYAILGALGVMATALAFGFRTVSKVLSKIINAFFKLNESIGDLKEGISELKEEIRELRRALNNEKVSEELKELRKEIVHIKSK